MDKIREKAGRYKNVLQKTGKVEKWLQTRGIASSAYRGSFIAGASGTRRPLVSNTSQKVIINIIVVQYSETMDGTQDPIVVSFERDRLSRTPVASHSLARYVQRTVEKY